jgi:hypothetical protein
MIKVIISYWQHRLDSWCLSPAPGYTRSFRRFIRAPRVLELTLVSHTGALAYRHFMHFRVISVVPDLPLTPLINIRSRIFPRIFGKIRNDPRYSGSRGTLIYEKNLRRKSRVRLPLIRSTSYGQDEKSSYPQIWLVWSLRLFYELNLIFRYFPK